MPFCCCCCCWSSSTKCVVDICSDFVVISDHYSLFICVRTPNWCGTRIHSTWQLCFVMSFHMARLVIKTMSLVWGSNRNWPEAHWPGSHPTGPGPTPLAQVPGPGPGPGAEYIYICIHISFMFIYVIFPTGYFLFAKILMLFGIFGILLT